MDGLTAVLARIPDLALVVASGGCGWILGLAMGLWAHEPAAGVGRTPPRAAGDRLPPLGTADQSRGDRARVATAQSLAQRASQRRVECARDSAAPSAASEVSWIGRGGDAA